MRSLHSVGVCPNCVSFKLLMKFDLILAKRKKDYMNPREKNQRIKYQIGHHIICKISNSSSINLESHIDHFSNKIVNFW